MFPRDEETVFAEALDISKEARQVGAWIHPLVPKNIYINTYDGFWNGSEMFMSKMSYRLVYK